MDFLLNLAHLQLHRRARALTRLTKLLRSGGGGGVEGGAQVPPLSVSALLGVVLPLLQQLVVEGKSAEDSGEWRGGGVGG